MRPGQETNGFDRLLMGFHDYIARMATRREEHWTQARQLIQELALSLLRASSRRERVASLADAARHLRVRVLRRSTISKTACISVVDGVLTAVVSPRVGGVWRRERERFALAHELGHAVFYRTGARGPERVVPTPVDAHGYRREEGLSDAFARALLLPGPGLPTDIEESPKLELVWRLARRFRSPPSVVLHRLVHDLGHWKNAVFYGVSRHERSVLVVRGSRVRAVSRTLPSSETVASSLSGVPWARWQAVLASRFFIPPLEARSDDARFWFSLMAR